MQYAINFMVEMPCEIMWGIVKPEAKTLRSQRGFRVAAVMPGIEARSWKIRNQTANMSIRPHL